jgi:protein gp37
MGENSKIAWTDHTFNPWWGCTKVSPGCANCYAESFAKRTGLAWGPSAERRFFTDKHWSEPLKWDAAARKVGEMHRVFVASMADVFENRPELVEPRTRLFALIERTPNLAWLLLTKRPGNIEEMVPREWHDGLPPNMWVGTTVENQASADERIPVLLSVPARVRFLSCEPLLGPVDLGEWIRADPDGAPVTGIDWVITGAESGPRARPMNEAWVRALRDQCDDAGISFFYKQRIEGGRKVEVPELDGRRWEEVPV